MITPGVAEAAVKLGLERRAKELADLVEAHFVKVVSNPDQKGSQVVAGLLKKIGYDTWTLVDDNPLVWQLAVLGLQERLSSAGWTHVKVRLGKRWEPGYRWFSRAPTIVFEVDNEERMFARLAE